MKDYKEFFDQVAQLCNEYMEAVDNFEWTRYTEEKEAQFRFEDICKLVKNMQAQ
jgi:hypothetical protein